MSEVNGEQILLPPVWCVTLTPADGSRVCLWDWLGVPEVYDYPCGVTTTSPRWGEGRQEEVCPCTAHDQSLRRYAGGTGLCGRDRGVLNRSHVPDRIQMPVSALEMKAC